MSLSDRFDQMEAKRVIVKPVFNAGASQRRVDIDSRRKVGRQTQFDARRQGTVNTKPAMRAAQSQVVSPRQQQQQQRTQQGRGRGRGVQAGGGRTQKTGGMPLRNNAQKTAGRGGAAGGRGPGRGAGRTNGRGNNNSNGGRGGGRGGRGGRGADKSGRGNNSKSSTRPAKNTDLDEGLDECEQAAFSVTSPGESERGGTSGAVQPTLHLRPWPLYSMWIEGSKAKANVDRDTPDGEATATMCRCVYPLGGSCDDPGHLAASFFPT